MGGAGAEPPATPLGAARFGGGAQTPPMTSKRTLLGCVLQLSAVPFPGRFLRIDSPCSSIR